MDGGDECYGKKRIEMESLGMDRRLVMKGTCHQLSKFFTFCCILFRGTVRRIQNLRRIDGQCMFQVRTTMFVVYLIG